MEHALVWRRASGNQYPTPACFTPPTICPPRQICVTEENHFESKLLFCFVFVRLKPFLSAQTVVDLWDVGWKSDSGPGKNGRRPDYKRQPNHFPQGKWGAFLQPATATNSRGSGGGGLRSATYPVEDIRHVRINHGVERWWIEYGEDKKSLSYPRFNSDGG